MILDDTEVKRGKYSPVCSFCRHYQDGYKCAAFDEISEDIWFGRHNHRTPYPGDGGIQYEPINGNPDKRP